MSFTLVLTLLTTGCLKQEEIPRLPLPLVIAIAPFNQPIYNSQLLAGYIPSEQSKIDAATMAQYDVLFKEKLEKTQRKYIFLSTKDLQINVQNDSKGRTNVLSTWAKLAQNVKADFIIVPQILDIEERQGDASNVRRPARLIADFYLIRANRQDLNSQNSESQDLNSQSSESQDLKSQSSASQDPDSQNLNTQGSESKNLESQDAEPFDGFLQTRSYYKEISHIVSDINNDKTFIRPRQKKVVVFFVEEAMNKAIRDFHL